MKKLLLTVCAVMVAMSASAAFTGTAFYEENFVKMGIEHDTPTDGWLTKGNGLLPVPGIPSDFFNSEKFGYQDFILLNVSSYCYAMCNTCFPNDAHADQWLISPEIEVPYDNATLSFTVAAYAAAGQLPQGANTYDVMISEGGTEREDFKQILTGSITSRAQPEINEKNCAVGLNGYKGKKIRVAFVATGANVGFTGFSNVQLSQYAVQVAQNLTKEFYKPGEQISIDYNLRLKAPIACGNIKATLVLEGSEPVEKTVKKTIGSATSSNLVITRFAFDKLGTLTEGEVKNYTLTIVPDFEGALPSVITGSVICPLHSYINNVVIEELTATGCSWCPRGFSALEYYHDTYPGTETQGKTISIAVHGYMNHEDPMNVGVEEYYQKLGGIHAGGLPGGVFNRATSQLDPTSLSTVEKFIAEASYSYANIKKVEIPVIGLDDQYDIIGKDVTVDFNVKNAYSSLNLPLHASVILIEDHVKGTNSLYDQDNAYYNQDRSYIVKNWGEWLAPYMVKYLAGGELGMSSIPAKDMVYEHVARLCYPTFYGEKISEEWEEDTYKDFSFTFKVPENVMNIENTQVVLLITNGESNKIVASDIMPYANFVKTSDVAEIQASSISIAKSGDAVEVEAEDGTCVALYALDGTKLAQRIVEGGSAVILPDYTGVIVVKAWNAGESLTQKLVF